MPKNAIRHTRGREYNERGRNRLILPSELYRHYSGCRIWSGLLYRNYIKLYVSFCAARPGFVTYLFVVQYTTAVLCRYFYIRFVLPLIGDAAAWADYLAGEGFRRVVLIGHSEGALIAFCAAQQTPKVAAVVSLAGAGYPLDEILQLQLASQLLPDNMNLLLQANAITAALKRGERVESCPPQLEALFHPSVQTFWISSLRYDPREEIRKVRVPILVVGGDNDLQVPPDNAEALAKAQPRARKAIIAGMTHPLKKCTGRMRIDQTGAYGDSTLPIDPDLVAVVTQFIRGL